MAKKNSTPWWAKLLYGLAIAAIGVIGGLTFKSKTSENTIEDTTGQTAQGNTFSGTQNQAVVGSSNVNISNSISNVTNYGTTDGATRQDVREELSPVVKKIDDLSPQNRDLGSLSFKAVIAYRRPGVEDSFTIKTIVSSPLTIALVREKEILSRSSTRELFNYRQKNGEHSFEVHRLEADISSISGRPVTFLTNAVAAVIHYSSLKGKEVLGGSISGTVNGWLNFKVPIPPGQSANGTISCPDLSDLMRQLR